MQPTLIKSYFFILPFGGWGLSVMLATLNVFWPITDVLIDVKDQVRGAWHVVFPLSLAHVVVRTIGIVLVVRDMAVFFFACNFIGWKERKRFSFSYYCNNHYYFFNCRRLEC